MRNTHYEHIHYEKIYSNRCQAIALFALMHMVRSMVLLFPFICSSPHRSGLHVTLQPAKDMHNQLSIGHGNLDAIRT